MTATSDARIKATALQLLRWLIAGDYAAIERFSQGVRMSATSIAHAVAEYGRTLVMPPASELDALDVVDIVAASPQAWSVRIDLWTAEEGLSDLSLECTFIDGGDPQLLRAEIDNLHVL